MTNQRWRTALRCPVAPAECPVCGTGGAPIPFRLASKASGSTLLRYGAPVGTVYSLRTGRARLSVSDAAGTERAFAMRGPGSLLGLEALLGLPASFDARMDIEGEVGTVEVEELRRWVEENPEHGWLLSQHVFAEATKLAAERQLIDGTAEARVARFLLGREANPFLSAWWDVRRHEMAGLLGMRPETLSRCIRTLQARSVVDADLSAVDLDALRKLAREEQGASPVQNEADR